MWYDPAMERIVHICNGHKATAALSRVDLPGEIRTWDDALDQGPVLAVGDDAYYRARGEFWATRGRGSAGDLAQNLANIDQQVDEASGADELILWFDHNLPDQLALVRLLSRLARNRPPRQLAIVSIDRHPEVANFIAIDQLNSQQLAQLWARRAPLSRDAIDEANAAWIAVTSADPRALPFLARRVKALPFLAGALERHLEELPDPTSGLTRTERELLAAIARGENMLPALVGAVRSIDLPPHSLLGSAAHPGKAGVIDPRYAITKTATSGILAVLERIGFVTTAPSSSGSDDERKTLSALGRQALSGTLDRIRHSGVDDWRGGVRLAGTGPVWRWDARDRKLLER